MFAAKQFWLARICAKLGRDHVIGCKWCEEVVESHRTKNGGTDLKCQRFDGSVMRLGSVGAHCDIDMAETEHNRGKFVRNHCI